MKKKDSREPALSNQTSQGLAARVETLEQALLDAQKKCQEAEKSRMRALADLENFRRRIEQDKVQWSKFSVIEYLKKMLPHFLALLLGAEHAADPDIQKVVENLFAELEKSGLKQLVPEAGSVLDTGSQEVILSESGAPGTVIRVLEPGWGIPRNGDSAGKNLGSTSLNLETLRH